MKSRFFFVSILAGLQLLASTSCSIRPVRPSDVGPIQNAFDLLRAVSSLTDSLRDLEARAEISMRIDGLQQNTTALVRYKRPDALKLDVSGALGIGLLHALAGRDSLAVYFPRDNRYVKGRPEDVLYRVTGVDLRFYDAQRAILGLPGIGIPDLPRVRSFEPRGDSIFVEIEEPLWRRRICVDRRTATVLREEIYDLDQGRLISQRLMEDYRDEGGVVLPRRTEIRQGTDRIRIEFRRWKVNAGIREETFRMKVPSDAVQEEVQSTKRGRDDGDSPYPRG